MEDQNAHPGKLKGFLRTMLRSIGLEDPVRRAYWRARLCRSKTAVELRGVRRQFWSVSPRIQGKLLRLQNEKEQLCELLDNLNDGDVMWDVGANVGLFSLFASSVVGPSGRVLAFEPEKHARRMLVQNCQLNQADNITVMDVALGDHAGEVDLFITPGASDFVGKLTPCPKHSKRERIRMDTGDHLVSSRDVPVPNVVKIDVEGAEYDTLNGMRETLAQPPCRFLLLELHAHGPDGSTRLPGDLEKMLEDAGFAVRKKWERGKEHHWAAYKGSARS